MILLPQSVRIYVATAPTNLHKSFEGLSNEVRTVLVLMASPNRRFLPLTS